MSAPIVASFCANPSSYEYCFETINDTFLCVTETFETPPAHIWNTPLNGQGADPTWKCGTLHNAFPRNTPSEHETADFYADHFHICTPSDEEVITLGPGRALYIDQQLTCPLKVEKDNLKY